MRKKRMITLMMSKLKDNDNLIAPNEIIEFFQKTGIVAPFWYGIIKFNK